MKWNRVHLKESSNKKLKCFILFLLAMNNCLGIDSNIKNSNWNGLKSGKFKSKGGNYDETPIRSNACRSSTDTQEFNITQISHNRKALCSPTSPSVPFRHIGRNT